MIKLRMTDLPIVETGHSDDLIAGRLVGAGDVVSLSVKQNVMEK